MMTLHQRGSRDRRKDHMSKHKLFRQGDVKILEVAEIPEGLKPVPLEAGRVILAHGEVTGHAHAVVGDVELFESDIAEMRQRFLRVESEAQVVHEEHDTISLPPGLYEIDIQREYTPAEIRTVVD